MDLNLKLYPWRPAIAATICVVIIAGAWMVAGWSAALLAWLCLGVGAGLGFVVGGEIHARVVSEHAWNVHGVDQWQALMNPHKSTVVLFRCSHCGDLRTETLEGSWTAEQIRAEATR